MNEHEETEKLVPFHYSVCRLLFFVCHNKRTNECGRSGTHRSQRQATEMEWETENEKAAKQNCHILFASVTIFALTSRTSSSVAPLVLFIWFASFFFSSHRSMIHSKSFVNSCIRWILSNFVQFFFVGFCFSSFQLKLNGASDSSYTLTIAGQTGKSE